MTKEEALQVVRDLEKRTPFVYSQGGSSQFTSWSVLMPTADGGWHEDSWQSCNFEEGDRIYGGPSSLSKEEKWEAILDYYRREAPEFYAEFYQSR